MADAGWYPDPADPGSEEYWDGQSWSGQRRPASGQHPASGVPSYEATTVNPVFGQQLPVPQYPQQPQYAQPQNPQPQNPQPQNPQPQNPQQPGYGGYPGQPGAQPWQGSVPGQRSPKRSKKIPLLAAAVVVVLVAAGVAVLLLRSSSSPSITYQGKQIDAAGTVLSTAEKGVDATVTSRHGVKSSDTRCYFAQPTKPTAGSKSTDINDSLQCGPVLFVDGDKSAEYLSVPLTAKVSGNTATLTPSSSLDDITPGAVGSDVKLVRPDGEKPPSGDGGLSVPQPPPATKNTLVATSLGSSDAPSPLANAVMVSKYTKVTLLAAGEIARYGSGSGARSAPSGQKLIAFQIEYGDGALDSSGDDQATLVIDGHSHTIPQASGDEWDIAAVPTSSTPQIQLAADGYTQTLSLPSGDPGSSNIAVLTRKHTTGLIGKNFDVPIRYSKNGNSVTDTFHATASVSNLYFWPPLHTQYHPSSPGNAYLAVRLNYTDAKEPGETYGFDAPLLKLKLPDGTVVNARNIAGKGKINDVFEVPADYTTGIVSVTGSEGVSDGITLNVSKTKSFTVNIRKG